MKILIGSPIKQKNNILKVFLENIEKMNFESLEVQYFFIDDNQEETSSNLLEEFVKRHDVILKKYSDYGLKEGSAYQTQDTHVWKKHLIQRITIFKDDIINYARKEKFDYLFLVDSDIVMNPNTIKHLISRNVPIVSEIFWTSWNPGDNLTPQVWMQDESALFIRDWDKNYTWDEKKQIGKDFIAKMKIPGLYEVGGLGACTLISSEALNKTISFKPIPNVSFWGEDRHFCIRAAALDIKLYVDNIYPAYHIYRESYLEGVEDYIRYGFNPNTFIYNPLDRRKQNRRKLDFNNLKNKFKILFKEYRKSKFLKYRVINSEHRVTLSIVVRNGEEKYLKEMLMHTLEYIDEYVIFCENEKNHVSELCKEILKNKKYKIIEVEKDLFVKEPLLGQKQWEETIKSNPDWILFLDINEFFEDRICTDIKYMLQNDEIDVYCFRKYEVPNNEKYIETVHSEIQDVYEPLLIRYQPKFKYKFEKDNLKSNRMPKNILGLNYINSDIYLKKVVFENGDSKGE